MHSGLKLSYSCLYDTPAIDWGYGGKSPVVQNVRTTSLLAFKFSIQNQLFREMSIERVGSGSRCLAAFLLCLAFPIRCVVPNRIKHHSNVRKGAMHPPTLPFFSSVMGGNVFGKAGSLLTCLENGEEGVLLGLKFKLPLLACNPAHWRRKRHDDRNWPLPLNTGSGHCSSIMSVIPVIEILAVPERLRALVALR